MLYSKKIILSLIFLAIFINGLGLFEPLLRNDDPVLYANIAKNIYLTDNWIDLVFQGKDWLDKPHFPFWLTALSFKIFGLNSFAYILPGFIFHLLGVAYTYKLAKYFYNSDIALLSALIYLTSIHLLLSAMDVRAEAYLLGEIMPACYYWLKYDHNGRIKSLFIASFFTALAMMTKGLFVVITIFSGLVCTWFYNGQVRKIASIKWLCAYFLCLIAITPELFMLYKQFDLHPEKIIYGHTHVSGLNWYFWGSQFGRFFNSGPIANTHGNLFFFVHTYLWAFLPWSLIFIAANYNIVKEFKHKQPAEKVNLVYILSSFWLTFIMFSATRFQLDHYTNIIIPFAAILCAKYIFKNNMQSLYLIQSGLSILLLLLSITVILYLFKLSWYSLSIIIPILILLTIFKVKCLNSSEKIVVYPSLTVTWIFILILEIYTIAYKPYDIGYNLAKIINKLPTAAIVYDIDANALPLAFYLHYPYHKIDSISQLPASNNGYYFILKQPKLIPNNLPSKSTQLAVFCGNTIDKILPYYHDRVNLRQHLECFSIYYKNSGE